jgi:hypothetical protein
MGIGAAHGVGSFALNTASAVSTLGWGLTSPFQAVNWMTGRSSFSNDWNAFQRSNTAFHEFGERWIQRALPSNTNKCIEHNANTSQVGGLRRNRALKSASKCFLYALSVHRAFYPMQAADFSSF